MERFFDVPPSMQTYMKADLRCNYALWSSAPHGLGYTSTARVDSFVMVLVASFIHGMGWFVILSNNGNSVSSSRCPENIKLK
jgi:hypothetical protein